MAASVSLKQVVAAMDLPCPTWEAYLDPHSGEIVTVTDEHRRAVEAAPAAAPGELPRIREALESDRFLMLPDQYDIHETSIMRHFAQTQRNRDIRHELLAVAHGPDPFRRFMAAVEDHGLLEQWSRYRRQALEAIARSWLSQYGIAIDE